MSRRTVHLDGGQAEGIARSLCGWLAVAIATDPAEATCRLCLRRAKAASLAAPPGAPVAPWEPPPPRQAPPRQEWAPEGREAAERSLVGEAPREGPRWSSIDRAAEHWARVVDDGAPVRSSFRTEAPVQTSGGSGTASSLSGREDVLSVGRALDLAYDTPRTFGAVTLSVAVQRRILEWRLCGRPVESVTAPGRKGRILRRVGVTAEELARALARELGQPVTPRHVSIIEGAGREAVYQRLVSAGEVQPMRGDRIPFDALVGLPEIAAVLGVTPPTAARYADEAPVQRAFRRGRVTYWSREAELRAWMERTRGPWTWAILEGA